MSGPSLARRLAILPRPDRVSLTRAGRGTFAALLALGGAVLLGLDSPFWAAMTVWAVAQPTRGALLGKCAARLAGTAVGTAASLALVALLGVSPLLFVAALAAWVGLCALLGNAMPGFRGYAALLSGYTAPLVALSMAHHPEHAHALALSRVACIAVGILASALVTWFAMPAGEAGLLRERVERLTGEACGWIAALLGGADDRTDLARREARLVADMAELDAQCDAGGSGAPRLRRERRAARDLLGALITAMAAARAADGLRHAGGLDGDRQVFAALASRLSSAPEQTPGALAGVVAATRGPHRTGATDAPASPAPPQVQAPTSAPTEAAASHAATGTPHDGVAAPLSADIEAALARLSAALTQMGRVAATLGHVSAEAPLLVPHRDWRGACRTGLRTFLTLLALGTGWAVTGWTLFEMSMMGAAILCSIFSSLEAPKVSIFRAVRGTLAGSVAAAACALLVLPHVSSLPGLLLAVAPFMFLGALALAERRTAIEGMDYSMIFLLMTAPAVPMAVERAHILSILPGPLLGALAAAAAFHFVLPTDPRRRLEDLADTLTMDLARLADPARAVRPERWRARARHRALRLVLRSSAAGLDPADAVRTALATLNLGEALLALRADPAPGAAFSLAQARAALTRIVRNPRGTKAGTTLEQMDGRQLEGGQRDGERTAQANGTGPGAAPSGHGAQKADAPHPMPPLPALLAIVRVGLTPNR